MPRISLYEKLVTEPVRKLRNLLEKGSVTDITAYGYAARRNAMQPRIYLGRRLIQRYG